MTTRKAKRTIAKVVSAARKKRGSAGATVSVRARFKTANIPLARDRQKMARADAIDRASAYLHAHGIDVSPGGLDQIVAAVVATLPKILPLADPSQDLTADEQGALARGGFDLSSKSLGEDDPLVQATAEYAALLKTSMTVQELAKVLGVHQSRIRQRLNTEPPSLYGFKVAGEWRIPTFLLDGRRLVPGVDKIAAKLDPELHPVGFYRWFMTPNPDLVAERIAEDQPLSPRSWLTSGLDPEPLAELASHL